MFSQVHEIGRVLDSAKLHTVFVMPSVNLTNSIVSFESRHSGRSVRIRLSAELYESVLS
jgi:hypothetical protein